MQVDDAHSSKLKELRHDLALASRARLQVPVCVLESARAHARACVRGVCVCVVCVGVGEGGLAEG